MGDERFIPHTADNGPAHRETWPPAWAGSIKTDDERLAEQVREAVRAAVRDPFGLQRRPLASGYERPPLESRSTVTTVGPQTAHRELGGDR